MGCRCATPLCDLDLTFDRVIVTMSFKVLSGLFLGFHKDVEGRHLIGILVRGCRCASWCDLLALLKCVHRPYLRHLSLMTNIRLLQLIIICTFM